MNNVTKIIIAIVAVGLLAGGYVVYSQKQQRANGTPVQSNSHPSSSSNEKVAATITYDGASFSPSSTTVQSSDTVKIINSSQEELQLDSNPHPVHTDDTDLNVGAVSAGQSKTFTVTKKGIFGFHNHLNPSITGAITIN